LRFIQGFLFFIFEMCPQGWMQCVPSAGVITAHQLLGWLSIQNALGFGVLTSWDNAMGVQCYPLSHRRLQAHR
jgi:hypothetical protein